MSVVVTPINAAPSADRFSTLFTRVNSVIDYLATVVVTANGDANGSLTTGNAFVNGTMSASVGAFASIRGGNVQAPAALPFTTNAVWGNSTVYTSISNGVVNASSKVVVAGVELNSSSVVTRSNRDRVFVDGVEVNAGLYINFVTATGVGINASYDAGNNAINVSFSTTTIAVGGANTQVLFNDSGALGAVAGFTFDKAANALFVGARASVGANVNINATSLAIGNSTVFASGNNQGWSSGNSTVTVTFGVTGISGGSGFQANAGTFHAGNSTVNSVMTKDGVAVSNSTQTTVLHIDGVGGGANFTFSSGNSTVNTTANSSQVTTPAVVTNSVSSGNSTVNASMNSSGFYVNGGGVFVLGKTGQQISGGATIASANLGVKSTGTLTIDPGTCQLQYVTGNGAFTIAAPAADGGVDLLLTNGTGAGAITFSGFTVGPNVGDSLTTTNGNMWLIMIRRIHAISTYHIKALQ